MHKVRATVWISIVVLVGVFLGLYFGFQPKMAEPIVMQTDLQPTIGYPKAPTHFVVFLDPKCVNSKKYNDYVYPWIKEKYIDTNKALYTVIPVAFLPGAMPAANALLCVYNQSLSAPNPDLFMIYLNYLYQNQPNEHTDWAKTEHLVAMAKNASPAIKPIQLSNCVNAQKYHDEIVANNNYEKAIIGANKAPILFINGVQVEDITIKNVEKMMKHFLLQKGVAP